MINQYKAGWDKDSNRISIVNHRYLDWKYVLENLENIFRRKVEGYSQFVDNFVEIKSPFVRDKGGRSIEDLVTS